LDNLETLTRVTKLQLDNNMLSAIAGLEALINLTWLGRC